MEMNGPDADEDDGTYVRAQVKMMLLTMGILSMMTPTTVTTPGTTVLVRVPRFVL